MKKIFKKANNFQNIQFIFVSKWMRNIAEIDVGLVLKKAIVIPNYVDNKFYERSVKSIEKRRKILLIRSFDSPKYANDLAIKAIKKLQQNYSEFNELEFTIIGRGKLWNKLTEQINFNNVKLINRFLNPEEIKKYHEINGVFLCPTRQDAQGVSMCEAMSSGLVPIASNNTAIPEFLDQDSGYLADNVDDIVSAIIELNEKTEIFIKKSEMASVNISFKTDYKATIIKECNLINNMIN